MERALAPDAVVKPGESLRVLRSAVWSWPGASSNPGMIQGFCDDLVWAAGIAADLLHRNPGHPVSANPMQRPAWYSPLQS